MYPSVQVPKSVDGKLGSLPENLIVGPNTSKIGKQKPKIRSGC